MDERSSRAVWVTLCFAMNFLYAVYLASIGVVLEPMGSSFGIGAGAQARLFPANFAGMVISVLLCGYLSDRFGRRRLLLCSSAAYCLALALFARAPGFGWALVAATFIGAGSGAMQTGANALVASMFDGRRRVMVNAAQIAFGAGAICGPLAASQALNAGRDWRSLYLALSALIGVLFITALFTRAVPTASHVTKIDPAILRNMLGRPAFINLCLIAALYAGAEVGFFQWMPSYFDLRIPGGARWAGVIVTLFWIGMTVGRLVSSHLVSRFPPAALRAALAAAGGLFSLAALAFAAPIPTMICVALTGVGFGGIFSSILFEAAEGNPSTTGTAFGVVVAVSGIGTALIPWAIGALSGTWFDWRGALCLVPLCAFAVAIDGLVTYYRSAVA